MACAELEPSVSTSGAQAWLVDNGTRLHLQHGPIDLIIHADGGRNEVRRAYRQAFNAFSTVLETLCAQLPLLRQVFVADGAERFDGPVARRMQRAVYPYASCSVTPMIAVAGAVADHVLSLMRTGCTLSKVMVNNGGDIALYLAPGCSARIGIFTDLSQVSPTDTVTLKPEHGVGGIATSGWRGRSHSLGIADAVTVLATDAASADVAATLIANAVDLPSSEQVERQPACELLPDSDLKDQRVTVNVGRLAAVDIQTALNTGRIRAQRCIDQGLVQCAYLHLQGQTTLVGADPRTLAHPVSQIA